MPSTPDRMTGRTVLITGGTGGIGKATAIGLAGLGARVGIVGRDPARGQAAADEISRRSGNPAVDAFAADLSCQAEVRRLAAAVLDTYPSLHVLVNNVGGFWAHRHLTADGLEHTFAVNHLASFLLTDLLLDRLKAGAPARIVTVASVAHKGARLDPVTMADPPDWTPLSAYGRSKLCNILFARALARRLDGTGVVASCLHPGLIGTQIGDRAGVLASLGWRIAKPFLKRPSSGAATSLFLATVPDPA